MELLLDLAKYSNFVKEDVCVFSGTLCGTKVHRFTLIALVFARKTTQWVVGYYFLVPTETRLNYFAHQFQWEQSLLHLV